ncbi:MAG: caspase family protein, partial [Magnetococcales bacterium]|nr:caspase family protein [Magnetococcales bacterium]
TWSSTSGSITTNNTVTATGPVTWTVAGNNALITVGSTLDSSGDITLKATGSSGQVLNNGAITTTSTGIITLEANGSGGSVTSSGNLTSNSGDIYLSSGTGGSTTANNALSSTSGSITLAAGKTVTLKNTASGNNITLRASDSGSTTTADTGATLKASKTVTLSAGTALTIRDAISAVDEITLTASDTNGTITTAKAVSTNGGANITATAGGNITFGGTVSGKDIRWSSTTGTIVHDSALTALGTVLMLAEGNIVINDTISSNSDILLSTRSSGGTIITSNITLENGNLSISGGSFLPKNDITSKGDAKNLIFDNNVQLTSDVTFSNNRGDLRFNKKITGTGNETLTLSGSQSTIIFNDEVGGSSVALGNLTIQSAQSVTMEKQVTVVNDIKIDTDSIHLNNLLLAKNLNLTTATKSRMISLGGSSNKIAAPASNFRSTQFVLEALDTTSDSSGLILDLAEMNLIGATDTVTIGSPDHTGTLTISALHGTNGVDSPLPSYQLTLRNAGKTLLKGAIKLDNNFTYSGPGIIEVHREGTYDRNETTSGGSGGKKYQYNIISMGTKASNINISAPLDIYQLGSNDSPATTTFYSAIIDSKGGDITLSGPVRMPLLDANGTSSNSKADNWSLFNSYKNKYMSSIPEYHPVLNQMLELRAASSNPANTADGGLITVSDANLFNLLVTGRGGTINGNIWRSWWDMKLPNDESGSSAADSIFTEPVPHIPRNPGFTFNQISVNGSAAKITYSTIPTVDIKIPMQPRRPATRILDTAKDPVLYDSMETYIKNNKDRKQENMIEISPTGEHNTRNKTNSQGPKDFILLIGVTDEGLKAPENDVNTLKKILSNGHNDESKRKVIDIVSVDDEQRTDLRQKLIDKINLIRKNATEDSHVLIYFSGHGIKHHARGANKASYYWVLYNKDGGKDVTKKDIISTNDILSLLYGKNKKDPIRANKLLLIVDSCFPVIDEPGATNAAHRNIDKPTNDQRFWGVLSSASESQESYSWSPNVIHRSQEISTFTRLLSSHLSSTELDPLIPKIRRVNDKSKNLTLEKPRKDGIFPISTHTIFERIKSMQGTEGIMNGNRPFGRVLDFNGAKFFFQDPEYKPIRNEEKSGDFHFIRRINTGK